MVRTFNMILGECWGSRASSHFCDLDANAGKHVSRLALGKTLIQMPNGFNKSTNFF